MNRYNTVLAAVAVTVVTACAAPNPQNAQNAQAPQSQEDKGYVTGSRLPVRNGSTAAADVKGISGKDAMDQMRQNSTSGTPAGPGK
jgi:hypothetical protein